ncbi:aminopeptidase N [Actinocrispum wychmicini]|uniref:Aminopeptidase N n=1 Tax=Actinocrispum wychmicini TaxID=1213861 RepID=A0A4R2JUV0_9PSEU|nr:aminopeptidase N [Actinocrispum wychmicini]TCO61108.1 aminopeptidase N [Actinocrispum wychmicini]
MDDELVGAGAVVDGGLDRREAAERARLLEVGEYEVHLDLTRLADCPSFSSRTKVGFTCGEPGASTWIDLVAERVTNVELNGVALEGDAVVRPGRIRLGPLLAENTLLVCAEHSAGSGATAGRGLTRTVDPSDGRVYVWSQCEAFEARRIFACFDQPDLKATFHLTVAVPSEWICVSNGISRAPDRGADTWRFSRTPRLPTYVFAVCAGPFHQVEGRYQDIPIRLHSRQSLRGQLDRSAEEIISLTQRGLAHYEEQFAVPYAGDSYDYVFLPEFGGAMENFGCVCWTDEVIFRSEPSSLTRQMRATVLLHEMAHMWFGNLVTMRWWDGLWLNESFADWAAFSALATIIGEGESWASFLYRRKRGGYRADQAPTTHAVNGAVPDIDAAEASVDMITYAKGASVLRQLAATIGEEAFRAALRRYFTRNAWRNTELSDLLAEVHAVSGLDAASWARGWLERSGTDLLTVHTEHKRGTYTAVSVRHRTPSSPPLDHQVRIGVYDDTGSGHLALRQQLTLRVNGDGAELAELAGAPVASLLLPNDDDRDFVKMRVDQDSTASLAQPWRLPFVLPRAVALTTLEDMMVDAQLPASAVVDAACGCVDVEDSPAQLEQVVSLAYDAATIWTPPEKRAESLGRIADACLRRLDGPGHSRQLTQSLRYGFTRAAVRTDHLDHVATLLARDADDHALRWLCLQRLVGACWIGDEKLDSEATRDPDPDAPARASIVRSARGTAGAKDLGLKLMFREHLPCRTQREWLSDAFWQPLQGELLAPYVHAYLAQMRMLLTEERYDALYAAAVAFPLTVAADDCVEGLADLGSDTRVPARIRKMLLDRWDLLRRATRTHRLALAGDSDAPTTCGNQ